MKAIALAGRTRGAAGAFSRRVASLGLAAALFFGGCALHPAPDWYRGVEMAPPEVEAQWARYQWYVADVKYDFHTRDSRQDGYSGPVSYANIYLVVKALTQEGAQIGTLNIPYWNQNLSGMDVVLLDSSGAKVTLDQTAILNGYRDNGVVVLPRVTRGCVVAVHIRQGPFMVLDYWEYPMQGLVPAWHSSFSFAYPKRLRYAWKGYNGLAAPSVATRSGETVLTWKADRVMPLDELPFLDVSAARPRLAITSLNGNVGQGFSDWKAVADLRGKEKFERSLLDRTAATRAKAHALADSIVGPDADRRKAASLLAWVQDNVGVNADARSDMDLDRVLEAQQGGLWQVAALLDEMYRAAGLASEIALTRDRDQGGFDSSLVTPNAAWEPVVIVNAAGREWAALPHARAYALGEYPPTLWGLHALSLKTGRVRALPQPVNAEAVIDVSQEAVLEPAQERTVEMELDGPWAALARTEWYAGKGEDLTSFCRGFLGDLGFQANLTSCAENGLDARDRPLRLQLKVANAWTWVEHDGARQWSLPDLFSRAAWFYDSARADAYRIPFAQVRRETAIFHKVPGMRLELDAPCRDVNDSLLQVNCRREEEGAQVALTREVRFPAGRYEAADFARRNAALTELERIRETRATLKPEALSKVRPRRSAP